MRHSPIHAMEREEFLSLAEQMGLDLLGEELDALVHHKLLVPLKEDGQRLCALHLYVLAQYDEHVRPPQHPWRAKPLADMASVKLLAQQVTTLAEQLRGTREPPRAAAIEELVVEMERYLANLDPFGPLGDILDLVREDVVVRLRGVGRRYVELRRVAAALAELAAQYEEVVEVGPMTHPVEISEPTEDGLAVPSSIDEIPSADDAVPQSLRRTATFDAEPTRVVTPVMAPIMEFGAEPIQEPIQEPIDELPALPSPAEEDSEPISPIPAVKLGLADESHTLHGMPQLQIRVDRPEPTLRVTAEIEALPKRALPGRKAQPTPPPLSSLSLPGRPASNPFSRDANQATAPNEALRERLESLRKTESGRADSAPTREVKADEREAMLGLDPTEALSEATELFGSQASTPSTPNTPNTPSVEPPEEPEESGPLTVESDPIELEELALGDLAELSSEASELLSPEGSGAASEGGPPELPSTPDGGGDDAMMQETRQLDLPDDELDAKPTMVHQGPAGRPPLPATAEEEAPSAEELAERVQRLNRLREQYIKAQDWAALAALYEDGVGLFDPAERAQIFETLSKLYEVKLKDPERAWMSLERAWLGAQDDAGRLRLLGAMERLGRKRGEQWLEWLEGESGRTSLQGAPRLALQRALATGLKNSGQDARAFLIFAAYIADHPDSSISAETLAALEALAGDEQADEVYAFYDDLLETRQDAPWRAVVARRAASWAAAREMESRAAMYWSRALQAEPPSAKLIDEIETFYLGRGKQAALVQLLDASIAAAPVHVERLEAALEAALEVELAHPEPESAMQGYIERLEQDPGDKLAYERLLRLYQRHGRHAESYAFLTRHLDRVTDATHKARVLEELAQIAQKHLMEPGEAGLHYEEALSLGGPKRSLLEALARVMLEQGQWTDAERAIDGLFTHQDRWDWSAEDSVYWGMLGALAGQRMGMDDRRRRYLELVLAANPEHKDARQALDAMNSQA
jgi:hypothetical protein